MERYNITLLEKYDLLEGRDVPMPHKKEWDNRLITEADGYQIPSNWSNRELDSLLIQLHSSIMSGNMSRCASECEMIAAGACYLRKPGRSLTDRLIDATSFGSEPLEWNPSAVPVPVPVPVCFSAADRAYGLFICGFLFKILSKSSQNVVQSWSRIKQRYLNFYSAREKPVKEWPAPQVAWLDRLKIQFSLVPRATRTALRLVNNLEMVYTDPQTVESGLIRYLFVMPLSYTGMHAYKLFCDVKEKTGQETAWLVSQIGCHYPMCTDALVAIDDIDQNWDLGGPNTNPAFRYARLLGPDYFRDIQTKSCPALVYCLARILVLYGSDESNYHPEQIVGLERLSEEMKAWMDRIAYMIYEVCNQVPFT